MQLATGWEVELEEVSTLQTPFLSYKQFIISGILTVVSAKKQTKSLVS